MRHNGMKKLGLTLTALILLSGCGTQSATTSTTGTTIAAVATSPAAPPSSAGPTTTSPTTTSPTTAASTGSQATLVYVGPMTTNRLHVTKTVTGATYERLAADLAALQPMDSGVVQCMVVTGETATITLRAAGQSTVYVVEGSPCRGIAVSKNGVAQPRMASSTTLLNQIRAIAGYTGMAHPGTG